MDLLASCAAIEGATSSRAVVEELEAVCDALGGLEQAEDRPRGLREIATTLVSERITAHRSSAVRLWAACCVCDVLRIYAPHAPYSNGELVAGFQVITEQLTRLGAEVPNATLTERCTYILDSLREFQSSCALVGLYHQDESALTALVDFVDAVIYSAREDGSDSARESAAEVLSTVLSECEPLPNELMERLLLGLTPAARKRNARAHWVVQQAMRERYEGLARPVAAYLRGTLSLTLAAPASESAPRRRARVGDSDGGDSDGGDSDGGSDASGESSGWAAAPAVSEFDVNNVYALVYEFHLVEPRMLLYILPLATERLRCDALATREKVVTLFAKLFAATHYDYAEQYREHYVEWLKRFRDTEPVMRARMVSLALKVIETRPQLRSDLLRHVARSFDDTAVDVRQQAVRLSCDFMLQIAPRGLDDASGGADWDCIIEKLYERTRDKRAEIRKEALTGLVQLYRAHVSDRWASANLPAAGGRQQRSVSAWDVADDDDEPDDDDDDNAAPAKGRRGRGGDLLDAAARATLAAASATGVAARRLQRVPELAIVSYASACNAGDVRDRARVLLDERLFNSKASAPARAAALLASVMPAIDPDASGSAHAQLSLAMLLKFQGVAQAKVQAYIGAHLAASADGADAAAAAGLDAAHTNLALLVYSRTGGKTTLPRELSKVKDRKMLRMLAVAVDCTAAREARLRAARDVGERVGAAGGRKNDDVKAFGLGLVSVCNDVLVDAFSLRVALQLGAHKLLRQQGRAEAVQEEDDDIVIRGCIALADIVAKNHPRLLAAAGLDTVSLYAAAAAAACDAESFKHAALALAAAACAQVAAGEAQLTLSAKDPDEDAMAALRCVAAAEDPQGSSRLDDDDVFFAACSKDAVAAIAAVTKSANDPDARGAEVERLYAALRCDESASWTYGTALPVLVARLRSLCRLVTHFADDFDGRPGAHDLIEEIDSALIASSPMLDGDTPDDSAYGAAADDSAFSYAFLALRAAVKLGAYHAIAASHAPQGRRRPQDAEWHRRRVERSLEVLFGILESGGSAPCGAATTSSEKAELRLTAASTALKLATRGGARLSVERWRALAYVALDADATVRFGFLRKLANAVRQGDAGMIKWGSVLCLAAIDFDQAPGDDAPRAGVKARRHDDEDDDDDDDEPPKRRPKKKGAAPDRRAAAAEERRESKKEHAAAVAACRKAATAALRRAVERARTRHHDAAAALADDDARRALLNQELPEYALGHVIHLLARRPARGESDDSREKQTQTALLSVLDPLIGSLGGDADNVAFLLALCGEIATYEDATADPKTAALRHVASTAGELVKSKYVKKVANLRVVYQGQVYLPKAMYAAPADLDAAEIRAHDAERLAFDRVSEMNVRKPRGAGATATKQPRRPASALKDAPASRTKAPSEPRSRASSASKSASKSGDSASVKRKRRASDDGVRSAAKSNGVDVRSPPRKARPTALDFDGEEDDDDFGFDASAAKSHRGSDDEYDSGAPAKGKRGQAAAPKRPPSKPSGAKKAAPAKPRGDFDFDDDDDDAPAKGPRGKAAAAPKPAKRATKAPAAKKSPPVSYSDDDDDASARRNDAAAAPRSRTSSRSSKRAAPTYTAPDSDDFDEDEEEVPVKPAAAPAKPAAKPAAPAKKAAAPPKAAAARDDSDDDSDVSAVSAKKRKPTAAPPKAKHAAAALPKRASGAPSSKAASKPGARAKAPPKAAAFSFDDDSDLENKYN